MDSSRFDLLAKVLATRRPRRAAVPVLAALGLGLLTRTETTARKKGRSNTVTAEDQLDIGARCDPPKTKHGKRHGCNDCRTGYSVAYRNTRGKTVRKCACKPVGHGATTNEAWQCCSGLSDGSQCMDPAGTAAAVSPPPPPPPPGPPGAPGPQGPGGPAAVCPALCPTCEVCNPATGQCEACPATCRYCLTTAERRTICTDVFAWNCQPCSSSAECTTGPRPDCVATYTDLFTGETVFMGDRCNTGSAVCVEAGTC